MQPLQYVVYFSNEEIVSSATHKTINKERVDLRKLVTILGEGKWKKHRMEEVCPLIKEWKLNQLSIGKFAFHLGSNKCPTTLRQIKEVRFPNLIGIDVRGNIIESVEGLSRVHLPKTQKLMDQYICKYLDNNKISSIADFRKVEWSNISLI